MVEVHSQSELETAMSINPSIVGVNNRNLKTMTVDLDVGKAMLSKIPGDVVRICESGIRTQKDIETMRRSSADGFLIGQSFMEQLDPGLALFELIRSQDN